VAQPKVCAAQFRFSLVSYVLKICLDFDNIEFDIFDAGGLQFSATLSHLLPLQLGFKRFQYIWLSRIWFAKIDR